MTMTLRTSWTSPFGRKARMAVKLLRLEDQVKVEVASPVDPADPLSKQNPLGKMPVLLLEDGTALYDSRVILDFLDDLAGGGNLSPSDRTERFKDLAFGALADGINDAGILIFYEHRMRPDQPPHEGWLDYQRQKIVRALDYIEANLPPVTPATVGKISFACSLGYLDLRQPVDWRTNYPAIVRWVDAFAAAVPAYVETKAD